MKVLITGLIVLGLTGCVTTTDNGDTALKDAERVICEELSTGIVTRYYNTDGLYEARKLICNRNQVK